MEETKCQECDKVAVMFEDDGCGWCYEHAIEHALSNFEQEQEEKRTGISELDVIIYAGEKHIPLKQAKEELLKQRDDE